MLNRTNRRILSSYSLDLPGIPSRSDQVEGPNYEIFGSVCDPFTELVSVEQSSTVPPLSAKLEHYRRKRRGKHDSTVVIVGR